MAVPGLHGMGLFYRKFEHSQTIGRFLTYISQTAPPDQNLPRIVSRFLTLGYESKICKQVCSSLLLSLASMHCG